MQTLFQTIQRHTGALALLLMLLSALSVVPARAQVSSASAIFLMIEPDSRSAGMGNAGVALADNAYASFWNPAGLAFQNGVEASLTHSNWLPEFNADLYYEYLVGKYHVPNWGTFGAQVTFLNLGQQEGMDKDGIPTTDFRSYDMAVGLSYGTKLTKNFGLGLGSRFIYSNLASGQVEGRDVKPGISYGLDLAGLYRTQPFSLAGKPTTFSAGFNLSNMGPKINYVDKKNGAPIPTNLRVGYAFTFDFDEYNSLTLANDFTKMLTHTEVDSSGTGDPVVRRDAWYKALFSAWQPIEVTTGPSSDPKVREIGVMDQLLIGLGAEYWYNKLFAARMGYFYENPYNGNRKFLTFGAGLRYSLVGVDVSYIYALEENHPLSNTMRFSILLNFAQ